MLGRLIDYIQTQGRNQRAGAQHHQRITDHEIVTLDTTDERIHKALAAKIELAGTITLDFLRGEERNR